jgi:multicomponent Na+:H+ antiporter subunit E
MFNPRRWFWMLIYIPYLFYYIVKANLDVAYRVLHPDVPIRPGIVSVRTSMTGDFGKTVLANSITLTPGTLSVDIKDDLIYVHWINVMTTNPDEQTKRIVYRFERILKRIFE